jgi:hypothetical protein
MSLEILLAERSGGSLTLGLPFLAIGDKDARSVELTKDISRERTPDIVLAVCLLDVLEISRVVDHMEAEIWNRDLICWAIALVERVPSLATGSAFCLELLRIASESLTPRLRYPVAISGRRRQDASVTVGPAEPFYPYPVSKHYTSNCSEFGRWWLFSNKTLPAKATPAQIAKY